MGYKENNGEYVKVRMSQKADISSKRIFGNHTLCAQFLRDYSGLELFANVQPEDIEDVSERYHLFREVEFNSDTVKKVRVRDRADGELQDIYVISLIEHKSTVDYDVTMQILKYMVCIWENYITELEEKEAAVIPDRKETSVETGTAEQGSGNFGRRKRINKRKDFRYPPIYPIVYYEGAGEWTAAWHLRERILLGDLFQRYIPDITYKLIRTREYSNDELLSKEDAISLIMLLNKIQQAGDFQELSQVSTEHMNEILQKASIDVAEIIISIAYDLCGRVNMPLEEAEEYRKELEGGNLGYLFENMEKMDIQLERRRTEEQRKKTEEERKRTEEQKKKTEEERKKTEEQKKKTEEQKKKTEEQKKKTEEQKKKTEEQKKKTEEQKKKTEEQKKKTEEQKKKTEEQRKKAEEQRLRAEKAEKDKRNLYRILISAYRKQAMVKEDVKKQLMSEAGLEENAADELIEEFWDN